MAPGDFSDPIMFGMTQAALAQSIGLDYEQAQIEMAEYEGDIPEFTTISDYNDFAITIHNAYLAAHE